MESVQYLFDKTGLETMKMIHFRENDAYIKDYPSHADWLQTLRKFTEILHRIYLDLRVHVNFIDEHHIRSLDEYKREGLIGDGEYTMKEKIEKCFPYTAEYQDYTKSLIKDKFDVILSNEYKESYEKFWKQLAERIATLPHDQGVKIDEYLAEKTELLKNIQPKIHQNADSFEETTEKQVLKSFNIYAEFQEIYNYFMDDPNSEIEAKVVKTKFEQLSKNFDDFLEVLKDENVKFEAKKKIDEFVPILDKLYETLKSLPKDLIDKFNE